MTVSAYI